MEKPKMTMQQIYVRLLTELNYAYGERSTFNTRLRLMDVLVAVRERVAGGGNRECEVQDWAEAEAREHIRKGPCPSPQERMDRQEAAALEATGERMVQERNATIHHLRQELAQKDAIIKHQNEVISGRGKHMEELDAEIKRLRTSNVVDDLVKQRDLLRSRLSRVEQALHE